MILLILDTDFLIALIRKDEHAINFLENHLDSQVEFFITHINLWELYQGVFRSEKIQANLIEVNELVEHFKIIDFTKTSALRFGKLINELRKEGKQIGVTDTLIASIALENNLDIVTRNVKHFSLTGVVVKSW